MAEILVKSLRWLGSWVLYGIGDSVSRPMEWFGWSWLYPIYNYIMCLSNDVQGGSLSGPWGAPQPLNIESNYE